MKYLNLEAWKCHDYGCNYGVKIFKNLYSSVINRMIRLKKMRWAEFVARIGTMRNRYKSSACKPEGRNHANDRDVGGDNIKMDHK